jgi:hypothetical protein
VTDLSIQQEVSADLRRDIRTAKLRAERIAQARLLWPASPVVGEFDPKVCRCDGSHKFHAIDVTGHPCLYVCVCARRDAFGDLDYRESGVRATMGD